ncbi:amino acid permease [Tardiphaga sp. vice352]|uniref:APC family permease n=1 Tax=unclassified Tardiphaga TaxID=2631404 RepID=UPI0011621958|nr:MULTISPECIES: APC family permease [unclassified Tardiphaga]QDM16620.1 amino acid permease [Tardiphaga sp. vice278]QDM21644.1 amino acid permease [Tardiphaga sp. vice154]QDM26830.1 amino acid permease [Tardiphaga sp. vice304]QDM31894.1 amino acid permease [Tardiphaga sp. vice352]
MNVQPADATSEPRHLLQSLTLTHAVLYGLGVTIGAGIYVLVGAAAGRSGMHAPLAFVGAALMMSFTAASFAELGTRMPVSASEAAYVQSAFQRNWLSLTVGLLVVAAATVSAATISAGSAGYIAVFVPLPAGWIIAGVVLAMGAVGCLATVHSVTFAGLMTIIEVGGLVLIIMAGMTRGTEVIDRLPEMWPAARDAAAWAGVAGTSLTAVFAFIGFEHLVNVAEEMKQPGRTLPRALFLTLGLTALIYGAIVWIAVIAVPPAELARSMAPLALVFERLTGFPLVTMSAIAVVATLNGVIVHVIMIGRVLYGLASQGNLPKILTQLNPVTRTPVLATAIGVSVILILALTVPLVGLADLTSRLTLVIFAVVNAALIRIKLRGDPVPEGAFTCARWVPFAGLISSIALLLADQFAG